MNNKKSHNILFNRHSSYYQKYIKYKKKYSKLNELLRENKNYIEGHFKGINTNLRSCKNKLLQMKYNLSGGKYKQPDDLLRYTKKMKKCKKAYEYIEKTANHFRNLANSHYKCCQISSMNNANLINRLNAMQKQETYANIWFHKMKNNILLANERVDNLEVLSKMIENMMKAYNNAKIDVDISVKNQERGEKYNFQCGGNGKNQDLMIVEQNLESYKKNITENNTNYKFLFDKITNLQERMTNIIESSEKVFHLRAKIEWMVNKLEEKPGENNQMDIGKLRQIMNEINKLPKNKIGSKEFAGLLLGFEKQIAYLESIIDNSSNKTINYMNKTNIAKSNTDFESINTVNQAGGKLLKESYDKILKNWIYNNKYIEKGYFFKFINTRELTYYDYDATHQNYSQYTAFLIRIDKLDKLLTNINKLISVIYELPEEDARTEAIKYTFEEKENIILEEWILLWELTFNNKNTNFYNDVLNFEIFGQMKKNGDGDDDDDNDILAKHFKINRLIALKINKYEEGTYTQPLLENTYIIFNLSLLYIIELFIFKYYNGV